MTIGIGVLCSTYDDFQDIPGQSRPDALILVADTMGSCETDSTSQMHKIYANNELPMFAVGAGRLDVCGELFSSITHMMSLVPKDRWDHGAFWTIISDSIIGYRRDKFGRERLPDFIWHPEGKASEVEAKEILAAWRDYDLGCEMLIGSFDNQGHALLYEIGRRDVAHGFVHLVSVPGHCAIGTGAYNASLWLNYRQQHIGCSVHRSVLHAYEAAGFASSAPTVNSEAEIVITTKQCCALRATHEDSPDHTEFKISEIIAEAKKYGPRNTKEIPFRRLNPQTLKDQQ